MCKDKGYIQKLLKYAGADSGVADFRQHTPKYYMEHPSELELPSPHKTANSSRKGTAMKDSTYSKVFILIKLVYSALKLKRKVKRRWCYSPFLVLQVSARFL